MTIKDFFYGTGGIVGDYDYGTTHLITVIIISILTITLCLISKKFKKSVKPILISIAVFQLFFEFLWRLLYVLFQNLPANYLWPLYPCNLAGIIIPIACLTNCKILKKLFYLFGFLGGIITFAMPEGIFNNAYLNFGILKSILQHTALILIPTIEYVTNTFKPKIKDFGFVILGLLIHIFNSEIVSIIIKNPGDYMFFRSGLPFVIPGIPSFITLGVFGLLVIFIVNVLLDIKGTKSLFKHKNYYDIIG